VHKSYREESKGGCRSCQVSAGINQGGIEIALDPRECCDAIMPCRPPSMPGLQRNPEFALSITRHWIKAADMPILISVRPNASDGYSSDTWPPSA